MIHGHALAGLLLATFLLACAGVAMAAEQQLLLEVVMNGRHTGQVREFTDRDDAIYAKTADLIDFGLVVPEPLRRRGEIALADLPGVRARVDAPRQALLITASDAALAPSPIDSQSPTRLAPITPAGLGAVLNYDTSVTESGGAVSGGALLDGRVFGPDGVFESGALVNFAPATGQSAFVRLNDTYTFSQPDALRRWRVGDVVTGALAWTRAVQLGGFQVASDFSMRSDLITYPLPTISGSAAVPSTLDVVANGVRQFSQAVQPGPFQVSTLPVVTGAGDVAVTVRDALGRQTVITLPFYASSSLLKPGLASFSLETGSVRRDYGLSSFDYVGWATNGSLRYGLTDRLTAEAHSEAAAGLVLLGGGVAVEVGTLGVMTAALAASDGRGKQSGVVPGPEGGALVTVGFQRQSRSLSVGFDLGLASSGYRDIAAVNGAPMPRFTLNAFIGYELGRFGLIGLSYVSQRSGQDVLGLASSPGLKSGASLATATIPDIKLLSANYSVPIAGRFSLFVNAYDDMHQAGSYGASIGVSFRLGRGVSASVEAVRNNGRTLETAQVDKPALVENEFGYRVLDTEGSSPDHSAEGEYLSPWTRVSAGIDQSDGQFSARAGLRGALVVAGGQFFATNEIDDSFAVVRTGDLANVPVLYENRPVGLSNAQGVVLVPFLRSFENNKLAIDPLSLPVDVEVGQSSTIVRPPDRSGVIVDFHVRRVQAALVKLRDEALRPIPLGAIARIDGAADVPVGYDGEAYVTGLKPRNRMRVETPDGRHCVALFDYAPVKGDIPSIGPITCRAGE